MRRAEWDVRKTIIRGFFLRIMVDAEHALAVHHKRHEDSRGYSGEETVRARLRTIKDALGIHLGVTDAELGRDGLYSAWDALRDEDPVVAQAWSRWMKIDTVTGQYPRPLKHITEYDKLWSPERITTGVPELDALAAKGIPPGDLS